MSERLEFEVLGPAAPQGSMRAFTINGKARLSSDNKKTGPYRQECGWAARRALQGRETPLYGKHVPVMITIRFYFAKPPSAKKSRTCPVVPPDLDKLCRATFDALKGVAWVDDAQVVQVFATKHYGEPKTSVRIDKVAQ
jgi:Holliday junction resolvase RusA-like endonuclease